MIIVNFKNYKTGKAVLALAKKIPKGTIVAVPTANISSVSAKTKLKVYAQHIDSKKKEKTINKNWEKERRKKLDGAWRMQKKAEIHISCLKKLWNSQSASLILCEEDCFWTQET